MASHSSCGANNAGGFWQLNGALYAQIPIQDRGLAYGDGLFETCLLVVNNGTVNIPCWPLHQARLLLGCQRLGLPITRQSLELDRQAFLHNIAAHTNIASDVICAAHETSTSSVAADTNITFTSVSTSSSASSLFSSSASSLPSTSHANIAGVIKLMVTRGQGGRGYAPPSEPKLNILWQLLPAPSGNCEELGITVMQSDIRLAKQPALAGLKHLNRLEYVLAAKRCSQGVALLLDTEGYIVETLAHNIFCVIDGELVTPILDDCGVKGVLRALIEQQLAPQLGLVFTERKLKPNDLATATEVFVGNSVRGIWPVTGAHFLDIAHLSWPLGPVAAKLQQAWLCYVSLS